MRRFVSDTGIILLALLVSGWGSTLAAALCPHAGMNQAVSMAEDHSCHGTRLETTLKQHLGAHGATTDDLKIKPAPVPHHGSGQTALGQLAGACWHCVSQSELPVAPASVRELILQKRDAGKPFVSQITLPVLPAMAVSVSQFVPSQHAPPGLAARTHLLLGVFLI